MSLYVKHQFYEHPSIAVVLARHLADNHVKPDAAQGTKVANLEKAIKNVNARLDSVQSSVDRMELFVPSEKPDIKIDDWSAGRIKVQNSVKVISLIKLPDNAKEEFWIAEAREGLEPNTLTVVSPMATLIGDGSDKARYSLQ